MPYVRIKLRSKKFRFMKSAKTTLFVVLISSTVGMAAVFINEMFSARPADGPDIVSKIVKRYKDNYGDNWKAKLKEDYKEYSNNRN